MLKNLLFILFIAIAGFVQGQNIQNMSLLSNVQFNESGNDIWGFVDNNGIEYAVIGTRTATRVYSLEDPANPIERYVVSGAASTWRDIKFYNNHLYITTDRGSDGLTIIDCTDAPNAFTFTRWNPEVNAGSAVDTLRRAHNIYIDTDTGICYLPGHNVGRRGVLIADLKQDPKEPVILSVIDEFYSHDAYVHNGRLYSSELGAGMAIYDVTDPSNPVELTRQETSRDFCHNTWATADNKYAFTTDERSSAYLDAYDVTEDGSALFLDRFRPLESIEWPVIPHNTHILGDFAITSWYTDGVIVTDISQPDNIIQVGQYDTYTNEANLDPNGAWFEGNWGTYPYLPSGLILVSDINTGLYVLGVEYKSASFLQGTVTSKVPFENGKAINGVTVEILGTQLAYDETGTNGLYKTGAQAEGMYKVAFSHPNYISDTLDAELVSGQITVLDAQLNSSYLVSNVIDKASGLPIEGAKVVVLNIETNESDEFTTDVDGNLLAVVKANSEYQLFAANWGHKGVAGTTFNAIEGENTESFELEIGYEDDFFADLGWKNTVMANSGNWALGAPVGTDFGGSFSNPPFDYDMDLGISCYTTGNNGVAAAEDDVDGGVTRLESPALEIENWEGLRIKYNYWFFNDGGGTPVDDTLSVTLSNGVDEITLTKVTNSSSNWSDDVIFEITPTMIDFTNDMRLNVEAGDYGEGHLVEAAIDAFVAEEIMESSVDNLELGAISIYPNPASEQVNIKLEQEINGKIYLINSLGMVVNQADINSDNHTFNMSTLPAGSYITRITSESKSSTITFVKL